MTFFKSFKRLRAAAVRQLGRASVLCGACVLLATLGLWRTLIGRERAEIARVTEVAAGTLSDKLRSELDLRALPLERLADRWSVRGYPLREEWMPEATLFAAAYSGYQAIMWTDRTFHVVWYAPEGGNAALQGLDWSAQPAVRAALEAARRTGRATASRTFNVAPAEKGFAVCAPVRAAGAVKGYVVGLFRTGELLEFILGGHVQRGFAIALSDGDQPLYSSGAEPRIMRRQTSIDRWVDVHGVRWRLRVWPTMQSVLEVRSQLPALVLITGLALSALVGVVVYLGERERRYAVTVNRINAKLAREAAEHQSTAEKLAQTNEILASVIETCPLAVIGVDAAGAVSIWNPAATEILGWTKDQVLGQPAALAMGAGLLEAPHDGVVRLERALARKDGVPLSAELWGAALSVPQGSTAGRLWLVADQSERIELEKQLRQSQKMEAVSRLAGGLAHDFNNLLAVIIGCGEVVRDGLTDAHPLAGDMNEILAAANRAASLTAQLLAFGRGQTLQPKLLDLCQFVGTLQERLRALAGERIGVEFSCAQSGAVRVDPAQLEQVLNTLTLNACEAMPTGGTLSLRTWVAETDHEVAARLEVRPGKCAVLALADSGKGMDDAMLAHVFEPFYTTKRAGRSAGFGLSTVHGIVKQNGGGIEVHSRPGQGTVFHLYFPLAG